MFGDGVNIAARLQALAPPGSVCLSETTHDYVHRVLPLAFEDLGPQAVKNRDAPVRAYLTRPSSQQPSRTFPLDHRRFEIYWARQLHSVCMAAMNEIAETVGLKGIDIPVLAGIVDEPDRGPHKLDEWVGIDRATVRQSTARLERKGLITGTVVAGKSGSRQLNATPEGLELRLRLRSEVVVVQDRLMAPLSDHEREMLKDLIRRVVEADVDRQSG
jgi:DNA-binding MarR family transcriptional regulator